MPSTTGLAPHVASALAYLAGPLSGALVLMAERSNTDVRFHAWQAIIALGAMWAIGLALYVVAFASIFLSASALLVLLALAGLVWILSIVVSAACAVRAYKGQRWTLPLAGRHAERRAAL
jgi:uncharacterized membrane protein